MLIDLDAKTRRALSSLVYAAWEAAYVHLKEVENLNWEERLKHAEDELEKVNELKRIICTKDPLVTGEWY